jgi:hypothetical protein
LIVGVGISAYEDHGFEDADGIEFSGYPIIVSFMRFTAQPDPVLRDELCGLLALLFGQTLSERAKCKCLVLKELDRILAEFPRTLRPTTP